MNQEIEKKEYTKPEMEVVAFTQQANLLDCSNENDSCYNYGGE
ncbi:hypothetical protein [Fibrobacter sp.]